METMETKLERGETLDIHQDPNQVFYYHPLEKLAYTESEGDQQKPTGERE